MRPVQEFIEFCDHVRIHHDHDCWSITWLDTVRDGLSLVVRLAIDTGLNEQPNEIWEVGSHHARGFSLVEFDLTDWTLADDHVLLWDHQEAFSQLNFSARAYGTRTSCGNCMNAIAWSHGRGSRSRDISTRRFWRIACLPEVGFSPMDLIGCFESMPTFLISAISNLIFLIPFGRPTAGMKSTAAGLMNRTSCRC